SEFSDKRGELFKLVCEDDASYVMPVRAFSIVDKIPFLKHSGFKRFIVDFSGPTLRKADYRAVMKSVATAYPLSGSSRFNWKDGFFSTEKTDCPEKEAPPPVVIPALDTGIHRGKGGHYDGS
ncbi:MAG: hypothetical protein LBB47_03320, partial [Spirochaetaceae bacterium]|nr:hypothetical protein [Spirochaetaceae bacterium]